MKSIIEKTLDTGKKIAMTAILTYGQLEFLKTKKREVQELKKQKRLNEKSLNIKINAR